MAKSKLCPKCTDAILRDVRLDVDIASLEPSWRFYLRSRLAKPFFKIGAWVIGMPLEFRRTWTVHKGGKNGKEKGH